MPTATADQIGLGVALFLRDGATAGLRQFAATVQQTQAAVARSVASINGAMSRSAMSGVSLASGATLANAAAPLREHGRIAREEVRRTREVERSAARFAREETRIQRESDRATVKAARAELRQKRDEERSAARAAREEARRAREADRTAARIARAERRADDRGESERGGRWSQVMVGLDAALNLYGRVRDVVTGLVSKITSLGSQAETSQLGIAAMLQAGGAEGLQEGAEGFRQAMTMSAEVIAQMRKDARALPGEFADVENIFRGVLQGGLVAGQTPKVIAEFSGQMMAVTKTLGIASDQAGREMAEIFENRGGAHNKVFMRLRAYLQTQDARAFNQLDATAKFEEIAKAVSKFGPAIKEYENTWDAVSSTAADNIRETFKAATGEAFGALKDVLLDVNAYFDAHRESLQALAKEYGERLAGGIRAAWEWMKQVAVDAQLWWSNHRDLVIGAAGAVMDFASGVYSALKTVAGGLYTVVMTVVLIVRAVDRAIGNFLRWIGVTKEQTSLMETLGKVVGYAVAGLILFAVVGKAIAVVTAVVKGAALAMELLEGAIWLVNAAMYANPIGLIVAGVAALALGILIAIAYIKELRVQFLEMMQSPAFRGVMQALSAMTGNTALSGMLNTIGNNPEAVNAEIARLRGEIADQEARGRGGFVGHVKELFDPGGGGVVAGSEAATPAERAQATDFASMLTNLQSGASDAGAGVLKRETTINLNVDGKTLHSVVADEEGEVRDREGR